MDIRDYLETHKLITDGSFGTYYAGKYQTQEMPELANIQHPKRVTEIHRSYIDAGAKLIRTNTFAANTVLLGTDIDHVKENIRAAIRLAKQAAESETEEIFIAGDIGPIPGNGQASLTEEYDQIAKTFLEEGISVLTFETFSSLADIRSVLVRIRQESDAFLMVQFCINQFGYSSLGLSAKKLIAEADGMPEMDAVGFNCGVGPGHMERILTQMPFRHGKYVIALPNAGYPMRGGRQIEFANSPVYFAEKVTEMAEWGIDIAGGCCGTTPIFIQKLSESMDICRKEKRQPGIISEAVKKPAKKQGFLYQKDGSMKQRKVIAVELAPPANADDEKLLEAAHLLKNADVDVLTFPDSPSGRTRVDSVLMAAKVRMETGMEVMPHICCRDKNAIAMRSLFLGANINGIHNMLIITGDPIPSIERQTIKGVFNFDSVGLMRIAKEMNEENFADSPFSYGGAINQGRRNLEVEIGRVKKKMEAGAEFFLTQPVFSEEDVSRLFRIKEETGARILCGIMPLISRKNALFMKNEIAGISVTDEIVSRFPEHGTKAGGEAVGIEIAKEMIARTKDFADGYYFSFPFNRVHLLSKILEEGIS